MMLESGLDVVQEPVSIDLHGRPVRIVSATPGAAAFWRKVSEGRWETDTFEFIDNYVTAETVFIDIGAWIGPISLYAAPVARSVLALEPDPVAWRSLERNIALNESNVTMWNAALGTDPGEMELFASDGFGRSVTSALRSPGAESIKVEIKTFADLDAALGRDDRTAVKIDIEGYEYQLFDSLLEFVLARSAPLHLSLHPRNQADARQPEVGLLAARLGAYRATWKIIQRLSQLGEVKYSTSGRPVTRGQMFRKIVLRGRPKNFSVVFEADQAANLKR